MRQNCEIVVRDGLFCEAPNAFRIVSGEDQEYVLDFMSYDALSNQAVVLSRIKGTLEFFQAIFDEVNPTNGEV